MRNSRTKPQSAKKARGPAEPVTARKPVDLDAVREHITALVGNSAVAMVETAIEAVGEGHYQAMKYLFEMIGLYPEVKLEDNPQEDSLAKLLLHHLGIAEQTNADVEATGGLTRSDAVE